MTVNPDGHATALHWAGRHGTTGPDPKAEAFMVDIIICATQRCGSTMFIEDMFNTGLLGRPEEYFLPWKQGSWEIRTMAALARIREKSTSDNGVFAAKIMADQLAGVEWCLGKTKVRTDLRGDFPRFRATFRDAVWVRLRREDMILQAISREMAKQSHAPHATKSGEDAHFAGGVKPGLSADYNAGLQFRGPVLQQRFQDILRENFVWDRFFASQEITPLEFTYEQVTGDADLTHLDLIAEKAGVAGPLVKQPRKLVKLGNEVNEAWKTRFLAEGLDHARRLPRMKV